MAVSAATPILLVLAVLGALAAHHLLAARLGQMAVAAAVVAVRVLPQLLVLVLLVAQVLNIPLRLVARLELGVVALAAVAHQMAQAVLVEMAVCTVAVALPAAAATRLLVMVGMALKVLSSSPTRSPARHRHLPAICS